MTLANLTSEQAEFRQSVKAFLAENLTDDLRAAQASVSGVYPEPEVSLPWQRILNAKGWAAPAWPAKFGGPSWNGVERFIFETECALAGAPLVYPIGIRLVAPVIQEFGSPEQQEVWLPRILDGTDYWCQGFSEPGAGSDLASLSTKARREGDTYVVNGSKIWTTHAHHANRMIALLRTSDTGKRQEGITAFGIDLASPGVEIRPIISIDGEHEVNEVFFSDLEVSVTDRIGEEGQGWAIAKYLLEFERGTGLFAGRLRSSLKRVVKAARELDRLDDREICEDIGEITAELDCFEMMEFATLTPIEPGQSPGPVASVLKLRASRLKQSISQLGVRILGEEALRFDADPDSLTRTLVAEALSARAATIFGGAAEIQLSIIAKSLARL